MRGKRIAKGCPDNNLSRSGTLNPGSARKEQRHQATSFYRLTCPDFGCKSLKDFIKTLRITKPILCARRKGIDPYLMEGDRHGFTFR
jgi:hypothetical protein